MHGLAYQHLQWAFTIIPQRLHRRVSFPNDIFSNNNLGVVVLTNTGFADYHFVNAISNYVSDQWLGLSIIDWSARFKTVVFIANLLTAALPSKRKKTVTQELFTDYRFACDIIITMILKEQARLTKVSLSSKLMLKAASIESLLGWPMRGILCSKKSRLPLSNSLTASFISSY